MKTLSIDIETYSDVPLQKTGVYRYVESPNFEILLFAYSADNQPVQVIDLACGEQIPKEVLLALADESVIKWATNRDLQSSRCQLRSGMNTTWTKKSTTVVYVWTWSLLLLPSKWILVPERSWPKQ